MNEELLEPSQPITRIRGVGPTIEKALKNLEVERIEDLMSLVPRRFEDRRALVGIKELSFGRDQVIDVEVIKASTRRSKTGRLIIDAKVRDYSGEISVLWFNQRYILKMLRPGERLLIYGMRKPAKSMGNPFFAKKIIDRAELVPIYPASAGLSQYRIISLIQQTEPLYSQIPDFLPEITRTNLGLPPKGEALKICHFSQDFTAINKANKVLAAEEILKLSLKILKSKQERDKLRARSQKIDADFLKTVTSKLPFQLTDGQRRATWEILQDLEKETPMNRLLYGEVGSGKTAVALLVAANTLKNGQQAALLAPTVALADQHYQNLKPIFESLGFSVEKNTSGSKLSDTPADIAIGTHALLENSDQLENLGLVIIDEQHRFGVAQREKLLSRNITPHLLMMTATPIPRSLAQTLFGHLEITYIAGKPPSQKKVETQIFTENERAQIDAEIATRLKRGEPGYVICPLITETHSVQSLLDTDRKAVASEHRRLTKEFPDAKIATLHGRLKSSEKESIVSDFRAGKIDILLSTTVVEVGIDNQAATWILIEEADRFGLAQLHQLRGRVGRGEKESVCFLMDSGVSTKGRERLEALQKTDEGLALAEEDLRLRGPGELIGFEQSGLPPLKHFDWSEPEFFGAVFAEAKKIINDGIEKYPLLVESLKEDDQEVTLSRA